MIFTCYDGNFVDTLQYKGFGVIPSGTDMRRSCTQDWGSAITFELKDGSVDNYDLIKLELDDGTVLWGSIYKLVVNNYPLYECTLLIETDMFQNEVFRDNNTYTIEDIESWVGNKFFMAYYGGLPIDFVNKGNAITENIIIPDRTLTLAGVFRQLFKKGYKVVFDLNETTSRLEFYIDNSKMNTVKEINSDGAIYFEIDLSDNAFTGCTCYLQVSQDQGVEPQFVTQFFVLTDGSIVDAGGVPTALPSNILLPFRNAVRLFIPEADQSNQLPSLGQMINQAKADSKSYLSSQSYNRKLKITFIEQEYIYYQLMFGNTNHIYEVCGDKYTFYFGDLVINTMISSISKKDNIITIEFGLSDDVVI